MEEIGRGAEAVIFRTEYRGRDAIVKIRTSKGYRYPDLDRQLRSSRTKAEVRLIRAARTAGVRTPVIYDVDLEKGSITMEYLKGESVKKILDEHPEKAEEVCTKIGEMVAKLHNNKISHGDLTTSNMIMNDGEISFIDFSLGDTRVDLEAMGVDIRLLERAFTSAHSTIESAFRCITESYGRNKTDSDKVFRKVDEIKSRGRYT